MDVLNIYDVLMILTFIVGYAFITIEHFTKISKTSIALLTAIICWILVFTGHAENNGDNLSFLGEHMANISQVVFFLLGALTIVEIINAHKGFSLISNYIHLRSKRKLLWLVGLVTFFLSSVLDNLTTTIIMVTLIRKWIPNQQERLLVGGTIVIAANTGGAWTPIGDVTTTMLWIGGQLSTMVIMRDLFLPSLACLLVALVWLSWPLEGMYPISEQKEEQIEPRGRMIFWLGLGCLISVPLFKLSTGLPPFMGILFGLALMWLITDIIHSDEERSYLRVPNVITKIDVSSILFFLGILLAIDALHTAGLLDRLANTMDRNVSNPNIIAILIGLASAVVDNVPLVAASMGMYELAQFPTDANFWKLIAYCAGTGGSILVIGSAAGVAFMGLENVQFFWYLRRIGIPALISYFVGIAIFYLFV
jgi:Na+/H+ antiporter NhaD/arsenite permease-like protein